ncbi:FAR1-related sequence 5-like protein [Tanacetum coccineum]
MVLIVEDDSTLVPHLESNVLQVHDIVMDVVQDDSNDNPAANAIDVYDIDPEFVPTPKGHKYWVPNVPVDEKPKTFTVFNTYDDAYNMYKEYAAKARFGVRKLGVKHHKGQITQRYVWCNKSGKPRKTIETNTLNEYVNLDGKEDENEDGKRKRKRRSSSTLTDCKARIGLKAILGTASYKLIDFVENHNHPLIDPSNMDLSRTRRQLEFGEYMFIHRFSLSNIGPQKAHGLRVALLGGFDKVRGMPVDWNNFRRGLNIFIGGRDAQMLIDKMLKRLEHVPEFLFYHHTIKDELCRMFSADETMKCNYVAFGDIVSFDATLIRTSMTWFLCRLPQPTLAVTDQDGALRNDILKVFTESHHRLCMWHITQKLPAKVLGDVEADSDFRKDFHKLVWNVYITPEVFQERWHNLISKYNLSQNTWLSDMYAIRERWVPGYFRELPFCGLMKTTSRSESSNAFLHVYSHHGNSPVHFMLCFESALEKAEVYTHSIFRDVQDEIYKGLYACSHIDFCSDGDVDHCRIRQRDKRSNTVVEATDYISLRWHKNPLPDHLRDKRHRNDPNKLRVFLSKVKDLKRELEIDAPPHNAPQNKDALYEDLLGVKSPARVSIKNPKKCPNKGHRRFKGAAEKNEHVKKKIDDALYAANRLEYEEENKRAAEEVNESDEDEEVNESEEDNDVDEYDDVEEDDELDEDDVNDDYDEDEDDA